MIVLRSGHFWPVLLSVLVFLPGVKGDQVDGFGPLYDHFRLTLVPGERTEILGPLISHQAEDAESTWTVSPLWSTRHDPETDFTEVDVLYPLLTLDRFGLDYRYQVLQLFSFAGGATMDEQGKHRITLFPLYFQQRSPDPALNYTAVVPFYGHLKNRLFRDEIFFVMLPFYLQSRKRDVVTDNYLLPFVHRRWGEGLHGWQVWPVVGREHKDVTTRTNQYNEMEVIGGHDKRFALWPFWIENDLGLGTTNVQIQRLYLPFYSTQQSTTRDTTSYLWPLGYTYTVDRERGYTEWGAPWPLIDFAHGEGKTLRRVWPLFSQGNTPSVESDFYLWPIYKFNRVRADPLDRERTRILFFLYSDTIERNTTAGTAMERTDLWPLFTARRDHNGNERLQVFAPVEPVLPGSTAIERNYSPLWSLWRSEHNAKTGARSESILWNLYRLDVTPQTRKCSLLFGLFHYQSGPEGRRWRVLYIPFGKAAGAAGGSSTHTVTPTSYVPEHW
jgi:hypothetical protein